MRKKTVYPHPFHNSGRKTGIEVSIARMKKLLKKSKTKREKKMLENTIQYLLEENIKNKKEGKLTVGDIEVLINEIGKANFIIDKDGNKIPIDRKQQKKEVQGLEDMQVKYFKKDGIKYIRKYSEPRSFDMK